MAHLRIIFASISGFTALFIGLWALLQCRPDRKSRSFAYHQLCAGLWTLSGYVVFLNNHDVALALYRLLSVCGPLVLYFLLIFLQELSGSYDSVRSTWTRRVFMVFIVLSVPLRISPLVVEDILYNSSVNAPFKEVAGPLQVITVVGVVAGFLFLSFSLRDYWQRAAGVLKEQFKFVAASCFFGAVAVVFYVLTLLTDIDWPFVTYSAHLVSILCLMHAVLKYRMLELELWTRRTLAFLGVYMFMAGAAFLSIFFRGAISRLTLEHWWFFPASLVAYGIAFSLAPAVDTFFRDKAEHRQLTDLTRHLGVISDSTHRLAGESGLPGSDIAHQVLALLKEFYWSTMNSPLRLMVVALRGTNAPLSIEAVPDQAMAPPQVQQFLKALADVPSGFSDQAFSSIDAEILSMTSPTERRKSFIEIKDFLSENNVEFCLACKKSGRIYGALLFGAKQKGVYWPEEMAALQIAAANVAIAMDNAELKGRTQELHDLDRVKRDLIANITHEFKSPLAVVDDAVGVLLKDIQQGKVEESRMGDYLMMVRNNAGRLSFFIQNLLEIAKIDEPGMSLNRERSNLNVLLDDVVSSLRPAADVKKLDLVVEAGEPIWLAIDREKIRQVIHNLVANGIKFTDSGRVWVAARATKETVRVEVGDTGQGIDAPFLTSIFDRFFQAPDKEQRRTKGSGLGLAIAKGWTEAHGGRVWAESGGRGAGAVFIVELPINEVA